MGSSGQQILLVGSPNSGKSSVFNHLSGLKQKVGNYPGVTVDKKTGFVTLNSGETIELIDLPGTYSLYPSSEDERVVLNMFLNEDNREKVKQVLYIANATNLDKSLLLLTQIADLGYPITCCLNLNDTAALSGVTIDIAKLEQALGIPVYKINGRTGEGVEELKSVLQDTPQPKDERFLETAQLPQEVHQILDDAHIGSNTYLRHLIACNIKRKLPIDDAIKNNVDTAIESSGFNALRAEIDDKLSRFKVIDELLRLAHKQNASGEPNFSNKLDRILTHKVWGSAIFLVLLFVIFQAIFSLAAYPMDWIDQGIATLNEFLKTSLPATMWTDFLTDGVITGLGGVIIFVPQIAILFGLIAILEESGYMARAVYLSDKLMYDTGLNGRSIVALISGVACAVPAIMATRTIGNRKERLITIFVTPFMSCSARLPVYIILSAFVVPDEYLWGVFSYQGLVMMGLYTLGAMAAIGSSWLISRFIKMGSKSVLIMELPAYQKPGIKDVLLTMYEKSKVFVFSAGKIILVIAMVLWVLASFGPGNSMQQAQDEATSIARKQGFNEEQTNNLVAARKIEMSYAGRLGRFIEPAIKPLGFDWKIGIALITSFAAREVFVSTMATIYSVSSAEDDQTIIESMRSQKISGTNEPVYTPARALSLLIFYVFAMQCMSTLAVVKRETKSWLIPVYQFLFMTGIAYIASFITFNLMS